MYPSPPPPPIPAALAASSFNCPADESTGYFADPDQCDVYWDCDRGFAQLRECPDGMAFSERARRTSNPCVFHWMADCQGRFLRECVELEGRRPS